MAKHARIAQEDPKRKVLMRAVWAAACWSASSACCERTISRRERRTPSTSREACAGRMWICSRTSCGCGCECRKPFSTVRSPTSWDLWPRTARYARSERSVNTCC
eukprot:8151072-Pyramimonas_sp.AAC.1